ncbi:hypothetical protein ARHIZOSPH14_20480 [Agromyces rhizosphaerae]|uniref:Regulator of SigK n=1 Tax=Agromyces rhizosphaerae TaxID=88374 RepID=A0A9W6CRX0_9MICO|nr:anti-sigma factor [Agromyces rhizosphaerae]GLI27806.1 hypothetical protein ARHIZOSPH14_20480 [Agromyces rhizosphaerae]
MTDRDREELEALAAAGALDALDDEERAALEAARDADDGLDGRANEYDEVAAALGAAAEPVAPPPAMRDALLARIAQTPQVRADGATPAPDAPEAEAAAPIHAAPVTPEQPAPAAADAPRGGPAQERARSRWGVRAATAVAAVAAASALLVAGIALGGGFSGPAETPESVVAEISAAPDARRQSVQSSDGATATLVWSDELDRTALLVDELPALGDDETYEAWVITDAGIAAAGLFAAGDGVTVHLIESAPAGATIGVTVEPAGGSDQPTTEPIIVIPTNA